MTKKYYPEVNPNPDFPAIEREVLEFWKENEIFKKSVDNQGGEEFVFYDGPPFANGLPHYGHLLTGFVKDAFARYQTMQGKKVERRFGWDCHGLPAEMGSEKELGISGRQAIANFGIDKFNEHCRTNVMKYAHEWEDYVTRAARWVDFKNDYKTMDTNFMESVLWAFKQLYDKGLIFEAHRVMPYSWAAETPLSNFETKLDNSYREREDKAITVAFELNEKPLGAPDADKYYILAWTTTPWTLPSNLALAVSKDICYVNFVYENICYTLADKALPRLRALFTSDKEFAEAIEVQDRFSLEECFITPELQDGDSEVGQRIIGLTYKPLFPYFADRAVVIPSEAEGSLQNNNTDKISHYVRDDKRAFRILDGSTFVTDDDGTGIVHLAPAFGEEDQKCCEANGIELVCPVDGQGKFTDEIFDLPDLSLKGLNVIAENVTQYKFGEANERIITWLKNNGKLIKQEQIKHNYPHCWRTDQPLIYRAMPSWYVEVTKFRDRAAELNQQINWIPEHIRDGQMGNMLKTAPDWSISRNRFWGTPIPVWRKVQDSEIRNQKSEIKVFGSIAEIEDFFGVEVKDLHRPFIDTLTIAKDGSRWRRVEDVFDCWFESGSMPFAQVHYPFENKDWFEEHFPADFITEYVGQTRGWFNTLIMLSTALFDKIPFKNCICHGVVLDAETGLKYSKRLKNYKDPLETINQFGADALRWLMLASPVMRGQDLMVDPEGKFIRDVVRLAIKPIWNAYNFFTLYANADSVVASCQRSVVSDNIMDKYIIAKMNQAIAQMEKSMNAYDTPSACEAVLQFFDALNNWYIRRNKERFWKSEYDGDKQAAYDTLYTVLTTMCRAAAPLLPLTCEEIYRGLTGEKSVHLAEFPSLRGKAETIQTSELIAQMDIIRDICNSALSIRNKLNIRVRQPLSDLRIVSSRPIHADFYEIIRDEINIKNIQHTNHFEGYATLKLSINSAILGKRLPAQMKQILPASKKGEWKKLENGDVEIAGEVLLAGEYNLLLEPKPEYKDRAQALSSNDALVILDTTITPELEAEGIARDVVRMIQQARKDANLNVSDKIKLYLEADEKTMAAIKAHQTYIMEQTLASELLETVPASPAYSVQNEIDNNPITISFLVKNQE